MADTQLKSYVEEHPKVLGILFALALFSTQVGSAMGAINHAYSGP